MVALVLREGAMFDGSSFAEWLERQPDLSPKWRPRFVRLCSKLPTTPTNKVLSRTLAHEKFRSDLVAGDEIYVRERDEVSYHLFTSKDEQSLFRSFESSGRATSWDL